MCCNGGGGDDDVARFSDSNVREPPRNPLVHAPRPPFSSAAGGSGEKGELGAGEAPLAYRAEYESDSGGACTIPGASTRSSWSPSRAPGERRCIVVNTFAACGDVNLPPRDAQYA